MAFTVFTALTTCLASLSIYSTKYNGTTGNPTVYYDGFINDNLSPTQLVQRDNDTHYSDFNYFNSRGDYTNTYPYDDHFVDRVSVNNGEYKRVQYAFYSRNNTETYFLINFDFNTQTIYGLRPDIHKRWSSTVTVYSQNPQTDAFCNVLIDFTVVGVNNDATEYATFYSKTFDLSGGVGSGYTYQFAYYDEGLVEDYPNPWTTWYLTMDLHLQDIESIYGQGYGSGYDHGVDDGYASGYDYGWSLGNSSSNSFRSLFGVLVDTPIIYLRKMFDYELFGISVFKALATVLSLIVALAVFRLVRGIF